MTMSTELNPIETGPLVLHLGPALQRMSDHEFFMFCQLNQDLRFERTSDGDLIIMPPTGGETGRRNFTLIGLFNTWIEKDGSGIGFDSSTGFVLPNGAKRSPDLAWVTKSRWEALTDEQREEFPPLCPDFVVELRSKSDSIDALKTKMEEYIENGAQLGWLIDAFEKRVYIYRQGEEVRRLDDPKSISGDPVLTGFVLNLQRIW
jgi:Uma2 family endonuclease